MIKIALFILPDSKLSNEIMKWKRYISSFSLRNFYLNDPPHCTLYVGEFNNYYDLSSKLYECLKEKISIQIEIEKKSIFFSDPITGMETIHYKIKKNNNLQILQNKIVNKIKDISFKDTKINFKDNDLKKNYLNYGYPFVYSKWKPHFTVGSIDDSSLIKEFIDGDFNYSYIASNISVYEIINDEHKLIEEIMI